VGVDDDDDDDDAAAAAAAAARTWSTDILPKYSSTFMMLPSGISRFCSTCALLSDTWKQQQQQQQQQPAHAPPLLLR